MQHQLVWKGNGTMKAARFASLVAILVSMACEDVGRGASPVLAPSFDRDGGGGHDKWSPWSEPMNLGAPINTAASERDAALSPDELSLYFVSDRPGGQGAEDLYVSRRASRRSPWGTPVNLGPVINNSGQEGGPGLSSDGHLLFFFGSRSDGYGLSDIYVSHRADRKDDFAWEAPVNLGSYVNTAAAEAGADYVPRESGSGGMASLIFNRRSGRANTDYDLYSVPITRDGLPTEPAAPIVELNTLANDLTAELSADGREVLFTSDRPGGFGAQDLWRSTRQSVRDLWSTPVNLGTPINMVLNDRQPALSRDGRTLIYASIRAGGFGSDDLWMATRTRIGGDDADGDDDGDD
jgi:WD40 repeat protein